MVKEKAAKDAQKPQPEVNFMAEVLANLKKDDIKSMAMARNGKNEDGKKEREKAVLRKPLLKWQRQA